jgi:hypothetical protein
MRSIWLLSCHDYVDLLFKRTTRRILQPGGRVGVIHWVHDASTPRGPSLNIRPKPEQCISWLLEASFRTDGKIIEFPPYHYGLVGEKV